RGLAVPQRRAMRQIVLTLPDLGDAHANGLLDAAIDDLVRHLTPLLRRGGDEPAADSPDGGRH
ncbi:hypothetical protein J8J27_32640, partial [Mycobacterium tuberculosis]|nr:hypothetical protein [Mycobacterium tuberculosis]